MRRDSIKAGSFYVCRERLQNPESPRILVTVSSEELANDENTRSLSVKIVQSPREPSKVGSTFKIAIAQLTAPFPATKIEQQYSEDLFLFTEKDFKQKEKDFENLLPNIREIFLEDPEQFKSVFNL